jgi:hypothetical protein
MAFRDAFPTFHPSAQRLATVVDSEGNDIYIGQMNRGTGMSIVGLLLLAAVLLVGCGQDTSVKAMNAKFAKVDYDMATIETGATPHEHLARLTRQYIALTREYGDQLGTEEVKRRLAEKARELAPYCLPCTATLDNERKKY